ncbi:MAG: alkaline phosphatase family protein [Bacteroidetes bacterium]|nr:alkaline phosphatase family protein [Bacteroidota bacterium]
MVGYGQMTEVMLWVQTAKPASVQYRYWYADAPDVKWTSRASKTAEEGSYITKTLIDGLKPGKKFEYELLLDGKPVKRPYPLRFQTQPLWQWRTDPPAFSVAFGSCAFINEAEADRPGKPYGSDYGIFKTIAATSPDLFIWTGDNTYLREPEYYSRAGIIRRYAHTREIPEMQPLLGSIHHYATWDDHDYGSNDADRTYPLKEASLETFKLFWANQTYGADDVKGVFSRFIWGDAEFFLLDDRFHRSPNDAPNDDSKTMFGKGQLQWLKDCLSNSSAPFKFIVNGNQVLNTNGEYYEAMPQFTKEYEDLVAYIKTNRIAGVIFLTGDRHHTELVVQYDSTFYPLYDFTSSALTSGMNYPLSAKEQKNPTRVEGTLVNDQHNFGMLRFSGPRTDRALIMECYDLPGTLRWSKTIKANDLKVK